MQVKEQMKVLRNLYLAVSNAAPKEPTALPDDLTAEKMVTVVTAFFKATNAVIRDVVEELILEASCPLYARFC